MERGIRQCLWPSRDDRKGWEAGLHHQAQEPLGGSSCPLWRSNLCLFLDFFFFFKEGVWILHFHSLPIEQPGYKRGPVGQSPPSRTRPPTLLPGPSSNHSMQLRSSKSH